MWLAVLLLFWEFKNSMPCRPGNDSPGGDGDGDTYYGSNRSLFGNDSTWGGWSPPEGDDSWKDWIYKWGALNNTAFDSTEEGQGPGSGWPSGWKNMGLSNNGVPPPPWSLVPSSYGKPHFCFLQPARGDCDYTMTRWGYNPTKNECQPFEYSGCGGNQNNFHIERDCVEACVKAPSTGCEEDGIHFEELINR